MTNAEKLSQDTGFMIDALMYHCNDIQNCFFCDYLVRDDDGNAVCLFSIINPNKSTEENMRTWLEEESHE